MLQVAACATVSVSLFPDTGGGAGTAEAFVYSCPASSTTGCELILADQDGDGVVDNNTLNGDPTARRFGVSDIHPQYIYGNVTVENTTAGRLQVVCKP
jgi:hypothetical protein